MNINKQYILLCTWGLSLASFGNPDVFFIDGKEYNDVYLGSELDGDEVKFKLKSDILGIKLPDRYFNSNDLLSYIKKH